MSFVRAAFASLAGLALLLSQRPAEATDVFYYSPQNVGNISGRAFADMAPPKRLLNMSTFGAGSSAVSQAVTGWQIGDFSGVTSPAPLGTYQRGGINSAWYGSTSVQMTDTEMGGQLHTWSIPGGSGYNYNLANLQAKYEWDPSDNILPWTHTTSSLRFQFDMKIPGAYMEGGAVGYVYASLLLHDPSGKMLWIQPQVFDTRGTPNKEFSGWDAGTNSGFVCSFYGSGTQYCTTNWWSNNSTSTPWNTWRTYSFTIDRTQLGKAISDVNSRYSAGLSTNVAGYRVIMFTVQDEIYWPTGNGWLPMGVRNLYLLERY